MDVRAYQYLGRTLVQYYDTGESSLLRCPTCSWTGRIWEISSPSVPSARAVQCPCCETHLATFASKTTSASETASVSPERIRPHVVLALRGCKAA